MIKYVICRQRIGVDVDRCKELYHIKEEQIEELLRNYVVNVVKSSEATQQGAIVSVRRDRL